jgi:hypothetical protein
VNRRDGGRPGNRVGHCRRRDHERCARGSRKQLWMFVRATGESLVHGREVSKYLLARSKVMRILVLDDCMQILEEETTASEISEELLLNLGCQLSF